MRGNLYEAAVLCPVTTGHLGGGPVPLMIGSVWRDLESAGAYALVAREPLRSGSRALPVPGRSHSLPCSSPVAAGGGGKTAATTPDAPPVSGQTGDEVPAGGPPLGFPVFATKNTTRVAGGDAIADAAAVALATYPARTPESRPAAVILAEVRDWRTGLAASVLVGMPIQRADPVRRRRQAPGRDEGRARRAAAHRLQGGGRRAGHPRGDEGAGRGLQDDRRRRPPTRPRWRRRSTALQAAAAGGASSRGRGRLLGPPRVRDARGGLGGQVRRPGAVGDRDGRARRRPRPRSRRTRRPRSTCSGPRTRCPTPSLDALEKLGTVKRDRGHRRRDHRDHLRALHRTATSAGRRRPGPRARVRVHAPPAGRRRRRAAVGVAARTGRCCCSPTPACCPQPLQDFLLDIQPGYDATIRSAASTTTAGSSATRARSPPPCRPA